MALESAKSLSTTVAQAVKDQFYDEVFLKRAEANMVHKQLGQVNRNIPDGQGGYGTGVVYWTRWLDLTEVTAGQGEGVPTTAISLSAVNVTGSTAQYDAAVSISDILAKASFGDVMKQAVELLGYNAGMSIDKLVRNVIATGGTFQTPGGAIAAAAWTSIPATATLTIADIRKSVRTLDRNNTPKNNGAYVGVLHPDAAYDLQGDTTTGGWIDANKYTSDNEKLLKGETGMLYGVRFLETSNGYVRGAGVTASASIYVSSIFGSDAFGVTNFQNLKTYIKGFSSGGTGDPTEKVATAGWKTTFGSTVLNSAFFTNIHHTVSSTA